VRDTPDLKGSPIEPHSTQTMLSWRFSCDFFLRRLSNLRKDPQMTPKRSRLRVAAAGAAAAGAFASILVPVAPAYAATCYGSACTGKSPSTTGCANDAVTTRSTSVDGIAVELRYSPTCRAAWGRLRLGANPDRVRVENNAGQSYTATVASGNDVYTMMVNDAGIVARACGTNVYGRGPFSHTVCTGWY
jgi:hypothetical protein